MVNQTPISYILKRSSRTLSLRIKIKDGEVLVNCPPLVPKLVIDRFVEKNRVWIEKNLQKSEARQKVTQDSIQVFGKKFLLKFGYDPKLPLGIVINGETLFFNDTAYHLKPKENQVLFALEKKRLETWLRQTASKYIVPRTHALAEKMQAPKRITHITLKNQDTRWGSCSSLGGLNFNYRLVHFAPPVIDYVIIHELAHLTHLNHSRAFWALVAKYDGAYKMHRRELSV